MAQSAKNLFFLPLLFAVFPVLWSQSQGDVLYFDHLTIEEGLSYSRVRSFCRDRFGFMWIGTEAGLNRYDGKGIKVFEFSFDKASELASNAVPALLEDRRGNFWVGTKSGLQLYDHRLDRFLSGPYPEVHPFSRSDVVLALMEDSSGRLWVGTTQGVFRITQPAAPLAPPARSEHVAAWDSLAVTAYARAETSGAGLSHNRVWALAEGPDGRIWIGTEKGLNVLDPVTGKIGLFRPEKGDRDLLDERAVRDLLFDRSGRLWIATTTGLFQLSGAASPVREYRGLPNGAIISLVEDIRGTVWVGANGGGLYKYAPRSDGFQVFRHDPLLPYSLGNDNVEALYADPDGGLWVGHHKGLSYASLYRKEFQLFQHSERAGSLIPGRVTGFAGRPDGTLWVSTDDGGVAYFDPKTGHFRSLPLKPLSPQYPGYRDVVSMLEDSRGILWIGTWGGGLIRFQPDDPALPLSGTYRHFIPDGRAGGFEADEIWTIYEDRKQRIWLGSVDHGLIRYDRETDVFQYFNQVANDAKSLLENWVLNIAEDHKGNLWVATSGGVSRFREDTGDFINFPVTVQGVSVAVYDIHPRPDGGLWLGTRQGLMQLDPAGSIFQPAASRGGLIGNWVSCMLEDDSGQLWLGTENGISRFAPSSGAFRNFRASDGILPGDYSGAHLRSGEGKIFLGNLNGMVSFHPGRIRDQEVIPPVAITDFRLFNQSIPVRGTPGDTLAFPSPLLRSIFLTDTIYLEHWMDDLSFGFAALNFLSPEENRYQYQLEGYKDDWIPTTQERNFAYFTNLSPGRYTFRVKGANNDGIWNDAGAEIFIVILPPWWATWWAYALYAGLFIGALFFLRWDQLRRQRLLHDLEMKQLQTEQLRALDEAKNRLYTNITHEFRTPLTVILGMADQVEKAPEKRLEEGIQLIRRNGNRLLTLVNQMLDLARLQSNQVRLDYVQEDIVAYLRYLAESFQSLALAKDIEFQLVSAEPRIEMDFDRDKMTKVVANLLSNAIKFTLPGGQIELRIERRESPEPLLSLQVRDSGIGIPSHQLPYIFDRFYQADSPNVYQGEGTGVGLTLTRELVHLFGGEISVESIQGTGTTFSVLLPIRNHACAAETDPAAAVIRSSAAAAINPAVRGVEEVLGGNESFPLLLIVEDNLDVQALLVGCLESQYRILIAGDGVSGIEKALREVPDLIISDVMMPGKDGFEVCDTLKKDSRTSHVPIILLTARAAVEDRITGLDRGADAYMAKPFHQEELEVQIANLLESRRRLQARYLQLDAPRENASLDEKIEDAFLLQLRSLIESEMTNPGLSIEYLCREMGMSRMQLHRKIKALTDLSTSLYVRSVRLQKACALLRDTGLNISEVAYEAGFDDPKYFSRIFSEAFGKSPTQFREYLS